MAWKNHFSARQSLAISRGSACLAVLLFWLCAGSAGAAFETLGQTTRGSARSGAFAVEVDDASAVWYNVAALASGRGRQVLLDYASLYRNLDVGPDIGSWSLAYSQQAAGGRIGLGIAGVGADFYTETGLAFGYGRLLAKRVKVGLGVRLQRWSSDGFRDIATGLSDRDRSGSGLGIDLGAVFTLLQHDNGRLDIALSGVNLNEPEISEKAGTGIPRSLVVGVGFAGPEYVIETDFEFKDGDRRLRVGGEYRVGGAYDLRVQAGTSGVVGDGKAGAIDGGLQLSYSRMVLNYGYSYSSEIDAGGNQRLSFGFQF